MNTEAQIVDLAIEAHKAGWTAEKEVSAQTRKAHLVRKACQKAVERKFADKDGFKAEHYS